MNFKFWHDEIADMPTQASDGTWYDAETGLAWKSAEKPRTWIDIRNEKLALCDSGQRDYIASHALAKDQRFWRRFSKVRPRFIVSKLQMFDKLMNDEQAAHESGDFSKRDSLRKERRTLKRQLLGLKN